MRVLFVPRPDWKTAFGGDAVQMHATAAHLRRLGVHVEIARPEDAQLQSFDVVHLWTSLQMPAECIADVQAVQRIRPHVKVALSPVWAPQHVLRWMSAARAWLFARHRDFAAMTPESAADDLRAIAHRALNFQLQSGSVLTPYAAQPFAEELKIALAGVDVLLPNSIMELGAIQRYIGIVKTFHVVPNAVDVEAFETSSRHELPPELHDMPFALMSARFDARKQQDFVLLALKQTAMPLVFAGDATDAGVFERFRALGVRRTAPVYYFPRMPQTQLASLYRAARVHFLPSIFESPGLSSIEAALLDCTVVAGALAFEVEYFQEQAYYCDPCDVWSIASAVTAAFERYDDDAPRRARLCERIVKQFTWENAAEETRAAYSAVL